MRYESFILLILWQDIVFFKKLDIVPYMIFFIREIKGIKYDAWLRQHVNAVIKRLRVIPDYIVRIRNI